MNDRVEVGVALLAAQPEPLPLSEAVDRLESVSTAPTTVRTILDEAEKRGVIEREDGVIRSRRGTVVGDGGVTVAVREGDYECRRCGAGITEGHFVQFDAGELGPFGSSCVRKVTGRD